MNQEFRLLFPLDVFYQQEGLSLPPVSCVEGEAVPEPYRRLLVGNHDMTPTLEAFHGGSVGLAVLRRQVTGETLVREVVLSHIATGKPVEFGAIVIHLSVFPSEAQEAILSGSYPLGTILAMYDIRHLSCPQAFLAVQSDATINQALHLSTSHLLYGRRNILLTPDNQIFADIVEILPPVSP